MNIYDNQARIIIPEAPCCQLLCKLNENHYFKRQNIYQSRFYKREVRWVVK